MKIVDESLIGINNNQAETIKEKEREKDNI